MGVEDAGQRHPAEGDLLDDAGVGDDVEPEAAVVGRDGHAEEAHVPHVGHELVWVGVGVLEVGGDGHDLLGHEGAHGGDELVGQALFHWHRGRSYAHPT